MASTDFQVILNNQNNLSKDRYVNTLYYDTGDLVGGDVAVMDGIAAAYVDQLQSFVGGQVASMTIKAYPPGRNPGGPRAEKNYAFDPTSGPAPAEVALCLSYFSENNQPRRRGRVYLGPFGNVHMSERPEGIMSAVMRWGRAIADIGNNSAANWEQHSQISGAYNAVTDFYCDNAWDTQRRRGATPTARIVGRV